jgi:hypothetical protein
VEKKIINGDDSCDLIWELFVGSTNSIPTEETGDAFWDRWLIKFQTTSASPSDMVDFLMNPVSKQIEICLPEQADLDAISFNKQHIKIFVDLIKKNNLLSDRSIGKLIHIAKCVKIIWEYDTLEEALGQTAKLVCSSISDELMTKIVSPEQRMLKDMLNLLKTTTDVGRIMNILTELSTLESKLVYGKSVKDQEKIKEYIERGIMNSNNDTVIDKYKSLSDNISMVDFIFGA